ncbi:MAG: GNAT family N-acetyltransferase [Streptosporangiaceae bacterium]
MVVVDITLYTAQPPQWVTDGCVAVYAAAFGQPPYAEPPADAELLRERVERYSSRDGFQFPVATDLDSHVTGFALAVRAYPGDWWRDQVAGAIGPELSARWLPPGVLEVVHVAVDPALHRRGVGRRLLASLIHEPAPSAVLSCDHAAIAAQQLYLSQGWHVITSDLSYLPGMAPRWLMGLPAG